ncbi:class I SAM-dependent methyltransferase [Fictibacillus fluitans]|uniref:Class I SAM-dependent methyltransferase n=1 Tax=Fictibacillus fluitans TaxID=3058422 RepID=A0ABT8HWG1_9BACL|nr:class I SAM-dependent methyltransferase [Fictibacillus sp. NE201]MDN4525116.1 class I SAM-dependent methyltransferase [Fictibacillus sp. NE201]
MKEFIDLQYQSPKGLVGFYFGEKMVLQHQPETIWTIDLLKLRKEERVLEIGCGAGYAMKTILTQPAVKLVVGLDLSKSMLRSAKLRNRSAVRKGTANLLLGNVSNIPLGNDSFTKVFSIHSIYFWDINPQTISEIYRVLKPNGTVTITLCNGKNGETWTGVQNMIEGQLIPSMIQLGFNEVKIVKGPDSRGFHTIAVLGEK